MDNTLGAVTDSGQLIKMEVDYSASCDEQLPPLRQLAAAGQLDEALVGLLALEKLTRTGADMHSTSRVLVAVVELCFEARAYDRLCEHIVALSKRRGQLKQSVVRMVQRACECVEQLATEAAAAAAASADSCSSLRSRQLQLIDTLRTVTEGKIYVEVERARLTHRLAQMREADGDVDGAATIMQELQVETYGSMERAEKVTLILEQMRLCLARNDFIRTQIISKKINVKVFDKLDTSQLMLKYYRLMIQLDENIGKALSVCQHYLCIYRVEARLADAAAATAAAAAADSAVGSGTRATDDTMDGKDKQLEGSEAAAAPAAAAAAGDPLPPLRRAVIYLLLAVGDYEQQQLAQQLLTDKRLLRQLPQHAQLLQLFCRRQLIDWRQLCADFEPMLRGTGGDSQQQDGAEVLSADTAAGVSRWQQLQLRVRQHNIGVIARYYRRIRLQRVAELLALQPTEAESLLCEMVVDGRVLAKVDRLAGEVCFEQRQRPIGVLTNWSRDVDALMSLVTKTTHLINKEEMVHKHLLGTGAATTAAAATTATAAAAGGGGGGGGHKAVTVPAPPPA